MFDHSWTTNAYSCASRRWDVKHKELGEPYAKTPAALIPAFFEIHPELRDEFEALNSIGTAEDRYFAASRGRLHALTEAEAETLAYRLAGGVAG